MTLPGPPAESLNSIIQELNRIKAELAELQRKTLYSASISGAGGSLKVKDGAEFSVLHEGTGAWLFHVGIGTGGKYYITMRRDNGTPAFELGTSLSGNQFAGIWDGAGNIVLSDDAQAAVGLATPWLPHPVMNVISTYIPMATAASWITLQSTGQVIKQQPKAELECLVRADGGGAGDARFTVNGVQVGTTMTIGVNEFAWKTIQTVTLPGAYKSRITVALDVQRTNGVGSVGGVFRVSQRQS